MKKLITILFSICILITVSGCKTAESNQMIRSNGDIFISTGQTITVQNSEGELMTAETPEEEFDALVYSDIASSVETNETPTQDGQSNFGHIGAKYAYFDDVTITILIDDDWVIFIKDGARDESRLVF